MSKKLSDLKNDDVTLREMLNTFNKHVPDGTPDSFENFKLKMSDPDALKVFNAMLHLAEILKKHGYHAS